ncbi:hypothetical protein TSAR_000758 [Trichomalopsis sarcophagae]|uniref:Uncharacterized protein n=1 Tax=Trichomalopsis sarcophagae TaxID=543379 RepID=A0A232EUW2_9HYME|nr:hypothetical protein TSAR_000758 [Trichomalopsis sarcophagae]
MASKNPRAMTLVEAVMWGTSKQVQDLLEMRNLPIDDNWTDYALLLTALRRKRKEITKILLNKGCRTKKVPRTGNYDTPLHYAVKMNDFEIIRMLLSKGASISHVGENGETPLCFAMKKRYDGIVDLLFSANGAECDNTVNNDKFSHFHIACIRNNANIVEKFINFGVNINDPVSFTSKEWAGYTPLHFAVDNDSLSVAELLLKCGANIGVKNAENMTPLHLAVQKRNNAIINLLLSSENIAAFNPMDDSGFSHFHIACMKSHLSAVKKFLQAGVNVNHVVSSNQSNGPGYSPLHFAAKALSVGCVNQSSLVELLLRSKADVNSKDVQGQTPLHLACLQNDKRVGKLLKDICSTMETDNETKQLNHCEKSSLALGLDEQTKVIELLLKYKSDINVKNESQETPIFYLYKHDRSKIAAKGKCDINVLKEVIKELNKKRKEILQILLNNHADINVRNDRGQTILHLIASINKEYDDDLKEETAQLILSKKAEGDPDAVHDPTVLHTAAKHGHWKLIELFLKYKMDVNCTEDLTQATPLHLATSHQQIKVINVLLQNNADVTMTKHNGMNLLHLMALINPEGSEEAEFIESYDKIIARFIELGCNQNAQDINGRTPLHLASWEHNNAGTWAFLQHFADINIEDNGGETPLSFPIHNTERCVNIYYMFKDYINMLKLTKLYVSEKTNTCYIKLFGPDPPDPKDDFLAQCREELEIMRSIKLNASSTVYDMLHKSSHEMEVHAGNELFERFVGYGDFLKTFNIYGNLLKSQYRKGLARKALVKDAKDALEFMTGIGLPDYCSRKIFQHLDSTSLSNLTKAKSKKLPDEKDNTKQIATDQSLCASIEKALAFYKQLSDKHMEM